MKIRSIIGLIAMAAMSHGCTKSEVTQGPQSQHDVSRSKGSERAPGVEHGSRTSSSEATAVSVDPRIAEACSLPETHFDFDSAKIHTRAEEALGALTTCLTTGPLAGRRLNLVGHADPRGELYYNFALGQQRAGQVARFLGARGMSPSRISTTSRGELDAKGTDEAGWAQDRRVDIMLAD